MKPNNWESFCDESYYGLWAVRPVGERRWGCCFHLQAQEEAEGLARLLTSNQVLSPFLTNSPTTDQHVTSP
jgi:hypothetical protein